MSDKMIPKALQTLDEKMPDTPVKQPESGSQLLHNLDERQTARERVLEKRRKHIREQYW